MGEVGISVVINTLNEEKNLPYALRSVRPWADEIVVVDMYSEDRTVEIAREFGAKVYFHERILAFDAARSFAIAQATGNWILLLDADEIVPAPLSRRLTEIARSDVADVVIIPWLNYLLGDPLMHTGWGPHRDKHPRFFKRGFLNTTARIHDFIKPVPGARLLKLPYRPGEAIVHFNYVDSAHFIEKLNRYTTIEARQAFERGERESLLRLMLCVFKEFVWRYLKGGGYKDGWRGLYLSLFMVFYRVATFAKLKELEIYGSREAVEEAYRLEAERILQDYKSGDLSDDNKG